MASTRTRGSDDFVLRLPAEISAVKEGRLAVLDYLRPHALDDKVINRVEVVLEELLSNVARHAAEATYLQVTAQFRGDELSLWIEDDGAAFNPLASKEPAPFDKLEDAKLGGLGIPLIKRLSRLVEYDRAGEANRMHVVIAA